MGIVFDTHIYFNFWSGRANKKHDPFPNRALVGKNIRLILQNDL